MFRELFTGRADVYAVRWANDRTGKAGWGPAVRGGWSKARDPDREYLPVTDEVIEAHLAGRIHAGLYPLLPGDTCRLLACDFDGPGWALDALAFYDAARAMEFPVALERSRSGNGGHVWTFFADPVPAAAARWIGVHLLREAMTVRAELDLASYDRLFPAQDFMPRGSFGNLIALPLQGACRKRGTALFLDREALEPFPDQWVVRKPVRVYVESMARWPRGERTVMFLLDRGRLDRIEAQNLVTITEALIDRARRRVATASAALDLGDLEGAYAAAYDTYRIAAESLLVCQGLRATGGEGSHMTVEDAVSAQFADDITAFAKPTFERMRRTRHTAQYFDPAAAPITADDARWAIEKATAAIEEAQSLFSTPPDPFD